MRICFIYFEFRVLHESLYGYYPTSESTQTGNGDLTPSNQHQSQLNTAIRSPTTDNLDADLAMALRISEQEQQILQEELKREQEMLEEVLRLSLEEK